MLDGCATCFKKTVFELDTTSAVEYLHPGVPVLDRDNVGLVLLLHTVKKRNKGQKVCVANTHLLYNPRRGDVKLAQLVKLFCEIDKISCKSPSKPWYAKYFPVILCGDFNSEPHSDLYKFLCRGSLVYNGLLCKQISGQTEDRPSSRMAHIPKHFIPKHLGLTDQCQYIEQFKGRSDLYYLHLEEKRRQILEKLSENLEGSDNESYEEPEGSVENVEVQSDQQDSHPAESHPPATQQPENTNAATSSSSSKRRTYTQGSGKLTHKLNLLSVYDHERARGQYIDKEITTYHRKANCTVDYILYSVQKKQVSVRNGRVCIGNVRENRLRLLATKELLTDEQIKSYPALPNEAVSSDHLLLMAKFLFRLK